MWEHEAENKMAKKPSKKREALLKKIDVTKEYSVDEAMATLMELKSANFDETVEVALNLNVDPRHADQMIRGSVVLPNGTGKKVRVAVFAKDAKADEAKAAGADLVGAADLIEDIQAGGCFVSKVKLLSAYTVTITGTLNPILSFVFSLKALQNSIIFTPRCPSAGPTGGDGFAAPAGIIILNFSVIFFAICSSLNVI